MKSRWTIFKMMVAAAALVIVGLASDVKPAHALQFASDSLVLAIYGNDTEALVNLGSQTALTASGASNTFDFSTLMSSVGGANPVQYALFGYTQPNTSLPATSWMAGSQIPASSWTTTQRLQIAPNNGVNRMINWQTTLFNTGNTDTLFAKTDGLSFSSQMGISNTLNGMFPNSAMVFSNLDSLINLVGRNGVAPAQSGALTNFGSAILTSAGMFTIGNPGPAAVPIPAAAVLFATGIIGLIGVARRKLGTGRS